MASKSLSKKATHREAPREWQPFFAPKGPIDDAVLYTINPHSRQDPIRNTAHAVERIMNQSDLLEVDGRRFLLVELTPPLENFLVVYGADREDLEDGGDAEPVNYEP